MIPCRQGSGSKPRSVWAEGGRRKAEGGRRKALRFSALRFVGSVGRMSEATSAERVMGAVDEDTFPGVGRVFFLSIVAKVPALPIPPEEGRGEGINAKTFATIDTSSVLPVVVTCLLRPLIWVMKCSNASSCWAGFDRQMLTAEASSIRFVIFPPLLFPVLGNQLVRSGALVGMRKPRTKPFQGVVNTPTPGGDHQLPVTQVARQRVVLRNGRGFAVFDGDDDAAALGDC